MSIIASTDALISSGFAPISLKALNGKAAMLERLDNKYVVDGTVLMQAAGDFADVFDMLEIDGRRAFTYETCYFDDVERRSYFDHHQGRRQRAKIRIRRYVEAGLCFLEVKLKDKRGVTIKKRLDRDPEGFGVLDDVALAFIDKVYRAQYGQAFPHLLSRVLDMRYRRMTLVARQGGERMTIDSGLEFFAGGVRHAVDPSRFILETKSANGNGVADGILRALHQHPTKRCSKYCVATALLNPGTKHNRFLPALRKLGGAPSRPVLLQPSFQ
ncbi:polyphosphate polymerase domain-containing protein [Aminobacter sp. MET-1]|uniref:polyphosphate polymerase domain-containing protein n=1 Tax=Aminobacter sp. MET-1 TaxID=2951085 RepID=UPI00226A8B02|nr:polyphosphate polymerase domain-containing protein [Aminobacter sp. MET-1]MCX8571977.1 polyphosphate polymerase domain-containing protein [Aminobacter sp. MET-1]